MPPIARQAIAIRTTAFTESVFPVLSCFAAVVDSTEPGSPISGSIPTALSSGALTLSGSEVF